MGLLIVTIHIHVIEDVVMQVHKGGNSILTMYGFYVKRLHIIDMSSEEKRQVQIV